MIQQDRYTKTVTLTFDLVAEEWTAGFAGEHFASGSTISHALANLAIYLAHIDFDPWEAAE